MTSSSSTNLRLGFTAEGWEDFEWWLDQDRRVLKKLRGLIKECLRTPTEGSGQPERLRHQEGEIWSRRITMEHRLVYEVIDDVLIVHQARYHYSR